MGSIVSKKKPAATTQPTAQAQTPPAMDPTPGPATSHPDPVSIVQDEQPPRQPEVTVDAPKEEQPKDEAPVSVSRFFCF